MLKYIWLYFRRRPGRILVFIIVVALGVAVSIVLSSIFLSFGETRSRISKINENWITVQYLSDTGRKEEIDDSLKEIFADVSGISDVIQVDIAYLGYNLFGSARANFPVYGIKQTDIARILQVSQSYIVDGRIFSPKTNEIMVSDSFLKASGVNIGLVYEEIFETASTGLYNVVAALKGPSVFGIGPSGISGGKGAYGFIVLSERGFSIAVESELRSRIAGEELEVGVQGPISSRENIERSYSGYYLGVLLCNLCVALVFIIGLTMLNSVSIRERRKEYGILAAIGHSPASLGARLFFESVYQCAAGWIIGLFAGRILVSYLETRFFEPNGLFVGDIFVSTIWTLVIPAVTVVFTQVLIGSHLSRDLVGLLKSSEKKKGILKNRFKNISLPWLRFPLRSDGYRSLFVNIIVFALLVTLFGSLLSSLTDTIRDSGRFFDSCSYVQTMESGDIELPEEIVSRSRAVLPASLLNLDVKLIFGTTEIFIPVVSSKDSELVQTLVGDTSENAFYVSKGLFDLINSGEVNGYGNSSPVVLPSLYGLSGIVVEEEVAAEGLLIFHAGDDLVEEIRLFASEAGVAEVVDRRSFEAKILKESQFMNLITSIIIYLQFFVVVIIAVVTVTRIVLGRRRELAIRNIIGQGRGEIALLLFGELILVLFSGATIGFILGTMSWSIFKAFFLSGVYISSFVAAKVFLKIFIMILIVLFSGLAMERYLISKQDPLSIIER
ncbi:ABC transporter permease [Mesotoga prima]|uniref:ABC transporter permease n=1 Tax=Mesotoga prima TaxID=1184387 RepID=UPI002B81BA54|nr:ABC transporter permease [Mesotoga prima]HQC14216.1 ABC transporter permease [Mesotoga prima]